MTLDHEPDWTVECCEIKEAENRCGANIQSEAGWLEHMRCGLVEPIPASEGRIYRVVISCLL